MNVRMGLLRKQQEWTDERFRDYWRNNHGPLAARVPNLREYWQNVVTDRLQRGIDFARGHGTSMASHNCGSTTRSTRSMRFGTAILQQRSLRTRPTFSAASISLRYVRTSWFPCRRTRPALDC